MIGQICTHHTTCELGRETLRSVTQIKLFQSMQPPPLGPLKKDAHNIILVYDDTNNHNHLLEDALG